MDGRVDGGRSSGTAKADHRVAVQRERYPTATCVELLEEGEVTVTRRESIIDLDYIEVTKDQDSGVVEGARGTVVDARGEWCTVEFLDPDGYTVGLFEILAADLEVLEHFGAHASVAREE
jgi:hypothetical protein